MSDMGRSKRRPGRRGCLVVALAIVAMGVGRAGALEVYKGEKFSARLDSTLSTGAAMRVEGRENELIYKGNDPKRPNVGSTPGFFTNADDGNLNYDEGDVYSANVKGTFELETDYLTEWEYLAGIGGFVRATGFYDAVGNDSNSTQRTHLDWRARQRNSVVDGGVVGAQWTFLDMYVDGRFTINDRNVNLRIGNQVLNWGEAVFNPGGINSTSAFDVSKLRIPGSELREGLVPAPMIRVSGDIAPNLGLEAYYQLYWNRTNVDPTGSYWSTNDLVGEGAEGLFYGKDPGGSGVSWNQLIDQGLGLPKRQDNKPSKQGQLGVATRYYWDRVLTEFGLYYVRYHSKTPSVGYVAQMGTPKAWFRQYADEVSLVGTSFAREVLSATLAGEVAYVWGDPTPIVSAGEAMAASIRAMRQGNMGPVTARGYNRDERMQVAVNLLQIFGPATRWGVGQFVESSRADNFTLLSEVAVAHYVDMERQCSTPFQPFFDAQQGKLSNCVAYAGSGPPDGDAMIQGSFPLKSDINTTSAGYQMFLRGEYSNPLDIPITVNPTFGWRHDFYGTTGNGTFLENRKAVSLGVTFDYLQVYGLGLTYGNFFGGGRNNLVRDRDFVSLSFTYRL